MYVDFCQWFCIIPLGLIPRPGISIQCVSTHLGLFVPITKIFSERITPMCTQTSCSRKQDSGGARASPPPSASHPSPSLLAEMKSLSSADVVGGCAMEGHVWVYYASGHISTSGRVSRPFPVVSPSLSHRVSLNVYTAALALDPGASLQGNGQTCFLSRKIKPVCRSGQRLGSFARIPLRTETSHTRCSLGGRHRAVSARCGHVPTSSWPHGPWGTGEHEVHAACVRPCGIRLSQWQNLSGSSS